ncbi:MAG: hypothetical protein HQM07_05140 [Zetaproteobacteria bacterium]|nr:hypothetical protein [Zetaproteobacteria bacterium]
MNKIKGAALIVGAAFLLPVSLHAASCCGGGSAASLVLPKFGKAMLDVSMDVEQYHGYWDSKGVWRADPPNSSLNQYRLNVGGAYRLADRWQISAMIPYVFNQNKYTGISSNTNGLGDAAVSVWYEAFDNIMCVWDVQSWQDLKPAIYWGATLTIPTGISPYDAVNNNFDITGRGFYRLDGSVLLDKTVYPWNATLGYTYGVHLERPVNREYGNYVQPYRKKMGDRSTATISMGYTHFTQLMQSITYTLAYAQLDEQKAVISGVTDATSGLKKRSLSGTVAWASDDRDWIIKGTVNHALRYNQWGRNFPTTNVFTMGVSHVFR